MPFVEIRKSKPSAPKRPFYSEAIVNAPLIEESKPQAGSAAWKRPKLSWQTATEAFAPVLSHLPSALPIHKEIPQDIRWIAIDDDEDIDLPVKISEGSVQDKRQEFVHLKRGISSDLREKEYAKQSVKELLAHIPSALLKPPRLTSRYRIGPFVPLHIFDDDAYEYRTWEEWLELAAADGEQYVLAEAYLPVESQARKDVKYDWVDVKVIGYDPNLRNYSIVTERGSSLQLPRIYVRFRAEDPLLFCERIEEAVESRALTEGLIRFHLMVDCMPYSHLDGIPPSSLERIIKWGTRDGNVKIPTDHSIDRLEIQIRYTYLRTMCALMLIKEIKANSEKYPLIALPEIPEEKVRDTGMVEVPIDDYQERRAYAYWENLFAIPESYVSLSLVVAECDRVANQLLFNVSFGKHIALEEFEVIQNQTIANVIGSLQTQWLEHITDNICLCLRDVGKGWYNLKESKWEIYLISKLYRLLGVTKRRMEYALYYMVVQSVKFLVNLVETPCQCCLEVSDDFVWGLDIANTQFKAPVTPVFSLFLKMEESGPYLTTKPSQFEITVLNIFDSAVQNSHTIKVVDSMLMTNLRYPNNLYLSSIESMNPWIIQEREKLQTGLIRAAIPLQAYCDEYNRFLSFYNIKTSEYLQEFVNADHSAVEYKDEINQHIHMRENYVLTIPLTIPIGPFLVHIEPLKAHLVSKREELITKLLEAYATRMRQQTEKLIDQFRDMMHTMTARPNGIEHILEIKEFMEAVPNLIRGHEETLRTLLMEYDILDHFWCSLSDEDFEMKWEMIGWPHKLSKIMDDTAENLIHETEKFLKIHITDEADQEETIEFLTERVTHLSGQMDFSKVHELAIEIGRIWKQLKETQEQGFVLNNRQRLFNIPVTPYEDLNKLVKEFQPYRDLWTTASEWVRYKEIWTDNPLVNVDTESIERISADCLRTMTRLIRTFAEIPGAQKVAIDIKKNVEEFRPLIPLLLNVRSPGLKQRHFDTLREETGVDIKLTPNLTFNMCLEAGLLKHADRMAVLSDTADKEYSIEQSLQNMEKQWEAVTMDVQPFKTSGTYIMKVTDEDLQMLDDHILLTQQMSFSPFVALFEKRVQDWEAKVRLIADVLEHWIELQIQWMYLEPIFSSEDIARQLPAETKKYNTMERMWRRIMKMAFDYPKVLAICPDKRLLEQIKEGLHLLEQVHKGLSDYLENKRVSFPRFYFLSDDELLEILAQGRNPLAVQPHLRKCFENIYKLRFEEDLQITSMFSAEGECVDLIPPMYPTGSVEAWLCQVEDKMRSTVRETMALALDDLSARPRSEWVLSWPGQIVIAGSQTAWTASVEKGIVNNNLAEFQAVMHSLMEDYRSLVRGKLSRMERQVMSALIVIEVHARDVLDGLVANNVSSINDFDWISQLRYYWVEEDNNTTHTLKVRAVNAEFQYGYEYLGNSGRLVITPLTDRCYLTLTGALHLNFGGAPAGPAGTGKTETTKDLAKAMAIQCVVFNCSDQLDVRAMAKFFKGLASSGAWACFDEFNRIDIEVLSVVAQQVVSIQKAQAAKMTRFLFEGVEIALKSSAAVFITMNPGYAGRTELPDNLKALFRPVAMMVPNYTLISEISLFSFGFADARNLANKITTTFKLSSEQLSSQDHYDFGMRAVKTVIAVAGNLKREKPEMGEPQIVLRAIRDVNVPKFLTADLQLFNGIVSDLFPRLKEESVDYGGLTNSIRVTCNSKGLQDVDGFVIKVIELYDTTVVRHGLMLVGPTGSGKTKCYEVLGEAITSLAGTESPSGIPFTPVHTFVLNPKSITMGQLYGQFDAVTHEWTDGILPALARVGAAATDADKRWYVFDGPVDAVWIENMNSVLDDNKKLCLTSGEIIKLTENMTMMFEVADLAVASPATVSRCGMVYIEPKVLGLQPFLECWLRTIPVGEGFLDLADLLRPLLKSYLLKSIAFLRSELKEILQSADICLVQGCFRLLDARLVPLTGSRPLPRPPFLALLPQLVVPWVVMSVVWSVGSTCDHSSRLKFSNWLRAYMKQLNHNPIFPEDGLVYDYKLHDGGFQDPTEDGEPAAPRWVHWMQDVPKFVIPEDASYSEIEVPTLDTVRSSAMLGLLVSQEHNVACVGPTGTGKTLTITAKLTRGLPVKFVTDCLCFSARTSANQTQDIIDSKLERRRKGIFGPPPNKRQLIFIDDFNMPALEVYGAQPPIELIRQWLDFRGWYDRKSVGEFRQIVDLNLVVAMGPPGGGRNPITSRVMRHFHYLAFTEMDERSKMTIFGTISKWWLEDTPSLIGQLDPFVKATLEVFQVVLQELLPTPAKTHYTFNLRDLSKVFQGILMFNPKKMLDLDQFLVLWYHENCRVYQDRLVDDKDRKWFDNLLSSTVRFHFYKDPDLLLQGEALYFGDITDPEREYVRIENVDMLSKSLQEMLDEYNSQTTKPMRLVLFTDALMHVCRIARVTRQPQGNALLLGMGGSGRQSLTKLAAFASELSCFQVEVTRAYGAYEWRQDIKGMLLKAGLHWHDMIFLFSDTQIKSESFLEDLNNILNSGDVPNIYEVDELDKIYQVMRENVMELGQQATKSSMFSAYQRSVKSHLHCIITMSPIGEVFRSRLRMFPALVNCCTIDWFSAWPDSALRSVAKQFLADFSGIKVSDEVRAGMISLCQTMHSSAVSASERFAAELSRHYYVTPTSYLEFLSSYSQLVCTKRAELDQAIVRLRKGLEKLDVTAAEVKELQKAMAAMRPALQQAQQETTAMLEKIAADTRRAERTKVAVAQEEHEADMKRAECAAIAEDAEKDLAEAIPALMEAEASLKALNKNDISEVRALKKPPAGVVLVIEAICIAKGIQPNRVPGLKLGEKVNDYWTPGSNMLANPDHFLASLVNYDKENVSEEVIKKLKPYIENPQFQPSFVIKVSKACGSLCIWTHAIYKFYFVFLNVKPKKEKLAAANAELEETESSLQRTRDRMAEILRGLEVLNNTLRTTEAAKAELETRAQLCEERMDRARRLLEGVASERGRWEASVTDLDAGKDRVLGDILVSAGAVAYLAPFTDTYRRTLLRLWRSELSNVGVPHNAECNPVQTLGDPGLLRQWQLDGLPRDSMSSESAVLAANSRRWPLFIDPQCQANRWIKCMLKEQNLSVMKFSDPGLVRSLENGVRFGHCVLLENIGEELDPVLDSLLTKATFKQGSTTVIKIGDTVVPYNNEFRLYLTTKLANPHYLPEVAIKVLLVNFALLPSGLTDQLLATVVMQERPDLEEARSAIVTSTARMKAELKEIEDRILERLSASQGSPVDDIDLILTLEASKAKSEEIMAKVEASEDTQKEIDTTRAQYNPVANRAQILFFCVNDLCVIDPMYQYSLDWFVNLFIAAMATSEKGDSLEARIHSINDAFTYSLYGNVCRSLFERHKLWFAVLVSARISIDLGKLAPAEWHFFLAGGTTASLEEKSNPAPNWLSPRSWLEMRSMETLPSMRHFAEDFTNRIDQYKPIFDSAQPHREKIPEPWERRLNSFQKLLFLKALRSDKLMLGLQDWVSSLLGQRFVEPQTADLDVMYKDSAPKIPLIFVLSTGTDPAAQLFHFAEKMRMTKRLGVISLGQGQGPRAEKMFLSAVEDGSWVFFQNCHLAPSWMPRLEQLIDQVNPDTVHRDFRIWLTSTPSPQFPAAVLQASSKMTVEPPRGVKANLLRAFHTQLSEFVDFFDSDNVKVLPFRRLVFALCLFHAVILERRKFGPLGFNIPYEFTEGDLRICLSQLKMFLLEYQDVPFKVMRYTAGQINYGGRVTDDWDRRTIEHLLVQYYNENVLKANHSFDFSGAYRQLGDTAFFPDYLQMVRSLPLNDDPELFGLHANADISCAQTAVYAGLVALLSLQPVLGAGAEHESKEDPSQRQDQACEDNANIILNQIPPSFNLQLISAKYPMTYEESFNTVLVQEVMRFNNLLETIRGSLKDLLRALKGIVVMSGDLEALAESLTRNAVPALWASKAYPSLKPLGGWVADLRSRIEFLNEWISEGIPPAFWISGFYFPQAFLTGTLQNYARKHILPIDTINFTFEILNERPPSRPPEGCVIYGLFMEGARWSASRGSVAESLPKELYTEMPPVLLLPEQYHQVLSDKLYVCPAYKTLKRAGTLSTTGHSTNYVLALELPTTKKPAHWIARGVALFCALDF